MQKLVRQAMPWILLALAFGVWFENFLPMRDWLYGTFGPNGLMRFAVGLLCLQVVLIALDSQRLQFHFKELVQAFRKFHQDSGEGQDPEQRHQALTILIGALESPDQEVRETAAQNLARLTGQSFGTDRAAWTQWLSNQ